MHDYSHHVFTQLAAVDKQSIKSSIAQSKTINNRIIGNRIPNEIAANLFRHGDFRKSQNVALGLIFIFANQDV
jgi:hypothetical protein